MKIYYPGDWKQLFGIVVSAAIVAWFCWPVAVGFLLSMAYFYFVFLPLTYK